MNKWTKVLGVVAATAMLIPLAACGGSRGTGSARVFAHFGLRPSPWR